MIVKRWRCATHGVQETKLADGTLARCALCGLPMEPADDPRVQHATDPRRQRPPRGETKPL